MEATGLSLAEQMHLDDLEIARRKELFRFTQIDIDLLIGVKPLILGELEAIVEEFYVKQTSIDEVALKIGDSETMRRLRSAQRAYIADLFAGFYDIEYVNNRLRIGLVHKRIGVEPKYYLSAVKVLRDILAGVIKTKIANPAIESATVDALDKLLYFDTELVFDTYIRSMMLEIEAAKDKVVRYARGLEAKVAKRTEELARLSRIDSLTGVLNKRAFMEAARIEIARAKRAKTTVSLVYLDIDGFKAINDKFGHHTGDNTLSAIGGALNETIRETDIAGRFGGDEFCVVFPSTDMAGVKAFVERLSDKIGDVSGASVSIGIAETGPESFDTLDNLMQRADRLMYATKANQRMGAPKVYEPNSTPSEAIADLASKRAESA